MQSQIITGGAGFIGSCYILQAHARGIRIINLDKLTYSGNLENLASLSDDPDHIFVQGDIGDADLVSYLLKTYKPNAIVNFAAESHVDRSILDPEVFVRTNVLGTCTLLRVALEYWKKLPPKDSEAFRFLHVSTDEVFGSLSNTDPAFTETTSYAPNSPYSASKAASDHLVRSFYETYGLPILLTNCSNNYGPRQFPEKLIPLMICNALARKPLPIYGKGENIRDWLHVEDHCEAIALVLAKGTVGRSYNIGGNAEKKNIDLVHELCAILDKIRPHRDGAYKKLIQHVQDRPGHDQRYAMNCSRIEKELGWKPLYSFEQGLKETVTWYLENPSWIEHILNGAYREWVEVNYEKR